MARGKSAAAFVLAWLLILAVVATVVGLVGMLGRYLWGMAAGTSSGSGSSGPENMERPSGGRDALWPGWDAIHDAYLAGTSEGQRNALANWWANIWVK